ncbi:MerR family transcriptional regulator [Priestia megaterium]|jgi:DNA-binding transcriptional MerR regulator|uniref:MerR family transcriptional regulator n=1 Tax=Priestia megaterium TaxID=1404 RepID=UPI001C213C84|nr:MerR family transcriptional regulator [Priestia megaterium]MBU8757585.1 MerR family transcriptional regulator [Priestia megaterium]
MDIFENHGDKKLDKDQGSDVDNELEFTIKEAANIIGETPNVVRNWMKELRDYIPHKKDASNGYTKFDKAGMERLKEIRSLHREQNWSIKQIENYFATGGESFKPEPKKATGEVIADELKELKEEIKLLREHNEQQQQFNMALIKKLDEVSNRNEEHYKRFDETARSLLETKKMLAVADDVSKNHSKDLGKSGLKGFLSRLFQGK